MTTRDELASLRAQELAELAVRRQRVVQPLDGLTVPFDAAFVAHVGQQATKVWVVLLGSRGPDGITQATVASIQRNIAGVRWKDSDEKRVSAPQVRRALARLNDLRLVRDVGWRLVELPANKVKEVDPVLGTTRSVFCRVVVGNVLQTKPGSGNASGREVEVSLPTGTLEQVERSSTRGGRRKGAGRPRAEIKPCRGFDSKKDSNHGDPLHGLKSGLAQSQRGRESNRGEVIVQSREETVVAFLPSEEKRAAAPRPSPFGGAEVEMLAEGLLGEESDEGRGLFGQGSPVALSPDAWSALPPFPGVAVVSPAAIPAPPMVAAGASEEERVALLLSAYNQTAARLLPREFNPHARQALKAPDRKVLVKAAALLLEHEVSPLRWAEFSFEGWAKGGEAESDAPAKGSGRGRPRAVRPPLRWVYAERRVAEKSGWARSALERRGSSVVVTRALRSLISRWQQMMVAVLRGEVSPTEAGEQFFPNGLYQRLVEKAQSEGRREQDRINTDIAAGKYLW